jgi:hypothetical protein
MPVEKSGGNHEAFEHSVFDQEMLECPGFFEIRYLQGFPDVGAHKYRSDIPYPEDYQGAVVV